MKSLLRRLSRHLPASVMSWLLYLTHVGLRRQLFQPPRPTPSAKPRRLLVDVSHQVYADNHGGISRRVRQTAANFLQLNQQSYQFEFVMLLNHQLYTARRFSEKIQKLPSGALGVDQPIQLQPCDDFLVLDCTMDKYADFIPCFTQIHQNGGTISSVIDDVLMFDHPEWFPDDFCAAYQAAFPLVCAHNDLLLCVSRATATDVSRWIDSQLPDDAPRPLVRHFCEGAEPFSHNAGQTLRPALRQFFQDASAENQPIFALISTIEPRKGQDTALNAFESLWRSASKLRLIFVGRKGWKADELYARILTQPNQGQQFFFLENANDTEVAAVYQTAHALISPSRGEGFGLPVVEAALQGKPVLVSDIPVYHEVAGEDALYFPVDDATALAQCVQQAAGWDAQQCKKHCQSVRLISWRDSAAQQLALIENLRKANRLSHTD